MGTDTNIGAAIFVRQHSGSSTVHINNNNIFANQGGRNLIADNGTNSITSGTTFRTETYTGNNPPDNSNGNVIDGLEVGLDRGRTSYGRADDLYGDADILNQDDNQPTPPTMNYYARGNTIIPNTNDSNLYDYDGIDINIGSYSTFNAWISGNSVIVNARGNAFTADFRGQVFTNILISDNTLYSQKEPIEILVGTLAIQTPTSSGNVTIQNNTMTRPSGSTLFEITTSSRSAAAFTTIPTYRINATQPGTNIPYSTSAIDATNAIWSLGTNWPIIYFNDAYLLPIVP
jgi:hypothetical protein